MQVELQVELEDAEEPPTNVTEAVSHLCSEAVARALLEMDLPGLGDASALLRNMANQQRQSQGAVPEESYEHFALEATERAPNLETSGDTDGHEADEYETDELLSDGEQKRRPIARRPSYTPLVPPPMPSTQPTPDPAAPLTEGHVSLVNDDDDLCSDSGSEYSAEGTTASQKAIGSVNWDFVRRKMRGTVAQLVSQLQTTAIWLENDPQHTESLRQKGLLPETAPATPMRAERVAEVAALEAAKTAAKTALAEKAAADAAAALEADRRRELEVSHREEAERRSSVEDELEAEKQKVRRLSSADVAAREEAARRQAVEVELEAQRAEAERLRATEQTARDEARRREAAEAELRASREALRKLAAAEEAARAEAEAERREALELVLSSSDATAREATEARYHLRRELDAAREETRRLASTEAAAVAAAEAERSTSMLGSMVLTASGSCSTKAGSCSLMFCMSAARSADSAAVLLVGLLVWLPPSARVRLASSVRRSTGGSSVLV